MNFTTFAVRSMRDWHETVDRALGNLTDDLKLVREEHENACSSNIELWDSCSDEPTDTMWADLEEDLKAIDRVQGIVTSLKEAQKQRLPQVQKMIEVNNRRAAEQKELLRQRKSA